MIVATIPAQHTAHTLLGTLRWLAEDPSGRKVQPRLWTSPDPMDLGAFRAWFRRCLDEKILARDERAPRSTWRKAQPEFQWSLWRDARAIADWKARRVIRRGSGLETEYGRRAAPALHARMRGEDE